MTQGGPTLFGLMHARTRAQSQSPIPKDGRRLTDRQEKRIMQLARQCSVSGGNGTFVPLGRIAPGKGVKVSCNGSVSFAKHERDMLSKMCRFGAAPAPGPLLYSPDGNPRVPRAFLFMDVVDGKTLRVFVNSDTHTAKPLSPKQRLELCLDTVRTVQILHRHNVVHNDLKLGNIMARLARRGARKTAKIIIIDFGSAQSKQNHNKTAMAGTPFYTAPLTKKDRQTPDITFERKIDKEIWALQLVVLCLLTQTAIEKSAFFRDIDYHHPFTSVMRAIELEQKPELLLERCAEIETQLRHAGFSKAFSKKFPKLFIKYCNDEPCALDLEAMLRQELGQAIKKERAHQISTCTLTLEPKRQALKSVNS